MKLKTKFQDEDFDLGEVADIDITTMPDGRFKARAKAMRGGLHTFYYNTKADFDSDWDDYEDSKDFWYIQCGGAVKQNKDSSLEKQHIDKHKEIGNYFSTKEEAEKAVEKLKAFTRLKDKGADFYGWRRNQTGTYELYLRWKDRIPRSYEVKNDLDLLFSGGKE